MIFLGIFLITAAFVFIGIGLWMRAYAKSSENEWKQVPGTIVSYYVKDFSSYETPYIQFEDNGETIQATGSSIRSKEKPAIGSVVPIEYKVNHLAGGNKTYQVIINTGRQTDSEGGLPPKIMTGVGILLAIIGIIVFFL